MPALASNTCQFYGTDYNKEYISWCQKNITNVHFKTNNLNPPLAFENDMFDVIYGISIFTHLTEELHFKWFNELIRVLKPGGILFLTLHGEAFLKKLTEIERKKFEKGELVERSNTKIGHRTFASFQPKSFIRSLIGKNKVVEFIPGDLKSQKPQQDIWIIRKSN
jgi:SAM-dependent methyltransferase